MTKIICKKIEMSQVWQNEKVIPVTVLKIEKDEEKAVDSLEEGQKVTLSGKSKGRGFQGVVKRHGFAGGPKSHGQKHSLRAPGSIGSTGPQRVMPGKKMAGRMGNERVTIKNITIVQIKPEEKTILIKGAVPGMMGSTAEIRLN
ncbi:MAG: 50S ribosomal protein L3, partial [Candidatus Paceibacterota bacterium]